MSERPHLLSIDDLPDDALDQLLAEPTYGTTPRAPFVVVSAFLTSSLRTRVGFAAAVARLGGTSIDVHELRWTPDMSAAESIGDTLRTVSGMADLLVVRGPMVLSELAGSFTCPVISAGDALEHPTQALVDGHAMQHLVGPWSQRRIALCGDLSMRAARSLLRLLARRPAGELVLVAPPGRRDHGAPLPADVPVHASLDDVTGPLDVIHMIGLPPGDGPGLLDDAARDPFRLTPERYERLGRPTVLSPLPVIDEVDPALRSAAGIRWFDQSDLGVAVRAAVLARALA